VISLLRWSGRRCGEAAQFLIRDIDFDRHERHVRHSKTRTGIRTAPLLPKPKRALREWRQYV
jgi:integrase